MGARVAVVGGGVAGLVAARDLVGAGHDVLLLEAGDETGGKLRRRPVGGVLVDVGAEAMLNRRPEGVEVARSAGLEVEHPAVVSSRIFSRGALRRLPRSLMGVPLDLDDLAASGVLDDAELARVREEPSLPPLELDPDDDLTVGDLVDARLGPAVTDRLVEPLLGGVYAGQARRISARAAVPQLVAMAQSGSLLEAGAAMAAPATYSTPVFAGLSGGMGGLSDALAERLREAGVEVRTGATVRELARTSSGFRLAVGPATSPERLEVDAVVLATPPAATARLLADVAPAASALLGRVESASVVVVSFAFRTAEVGALADTDCSGLLVPPVEGRDIKASTFSFAKWGWVREAGAGEGLVHLRTSLGRHGDETTLQVPDAELVARSRRDLAVLAGVAADPVDAHVQRWGGGLPQYAPGHVALVAGVRDAVAAVPGLAVCGAAYDGVGIPAVLASAHRAAAGLLSDRGRAGETMAP
ncbi:protoporphyrinogen oxidase [Nocardioides acrostichi]|uniref:Coproporphyrinogen III oxidase n=1 Tax=Nocardioides acrostichi TaxID=2784339 RepID=A0A930UYA7_9ACTN|nr:protoporphyrinogen oxidase [Nocardioides acrostichi]MBF4160230.1 protoporphyrinogen oxidase [Nocardioides acrostichi]